jgi:Na+/melibiose symporter-like transporter
MLIVTVLVFINLSLKGGAYIYYFENYLDENALATFLNDMGFNGFIAGINATLTSVGIAEFKWPADAATSAFGLFNGCGIIMQIIGICFSKQVADRFGKRNTFGAALLVSTLFLFAFNYFPSDAIGLCFISQVLHGFFYGLTVPLLWAMIADVADYSEWKNNRRATAIIFSAMLVGLKAGLSIGGSLLAGILAFYHYDASLAVQSMETIGGIKAAISIYASIPFFLAVACLCLYSINKKTETQIETELNERRKFVGR